MRKFIAFGISLAGILLVLLDVRLAVGQSPATAENENTQSLTPRQPVGLLSDELGSYLTIEGVLSEGVKIETGTFLVDTVNGKKLEKPISLVVRGARLVNHNLQPAILDLPAKQRCTLKGFESGEMIGVPPAIAVAATEQGWRDVPMSPVPWRWRSHFVVLVIAEPKGLQFRVR